MKLRSMFVALLAVLCFLVAVVRLERGRQEEGLGQLENALRRAAVSCYAAEGFYPPDVDYMRQRYALQWDETRYVVHYERFASNLMPDITVLEK